MKFNWKQYCSIKCQHAAKYKQVEVKCSNPNCQNTFKRTPGQISKLGNFFCSSSCAAAINNKKFPKRSPSPKTCTSFRKKSTDININTCKYKRSVIPKEKIIEEIRIFYTVNNRIPFREEFFHRKAAKLRFGTWNEAIKAAGFIPNPVRFAKKHMAEDGHPCDSLSEKIIDDWLSKNKIPHEINVPYQNTKFTADFKVKNYFIEFFGLRNGLDRYDLLMKEKIRLIKQNRLKLIAIYPKDIFPESKLDKILKVIK